MEARRVLADCHVALQHADVAIEAAEFRVSWAALVALLRAVGHVLNKVDGERGGALKGAIETRWQLWQNERGANRIFWDFIEAERNSVLKAYEFGYREDDVEIERVAPDGTRVVHSNVPFISALRVGPFAGQPGLEVAREALAWWEHQLDAIEEAANGHGA